MSFSPQPFSTPHSPPMGRGRGLPVLGFDSPVQVGDGRVVGDSQDATEAPLVSGDRAPFLSHCVEHAPQVVAQVADPLSLPSPTQSSIVASQMSDVIRDIGQQLADSIFARLGTLQTPAPAPATRTTSHAHFAPTNTFPTPAPSLDMSQVQFVPHRKVKEPPVFRGDSSDTVSVREWEDLMRCYVKKTNLRVDQQAEEILAHLRGRARDVVKFGTRNSGVDVTRYPEAIYSLLHKHFATVPCSSLPLAEFYTTLPHVGEDAYDYWLRLNRAADVAIDRLKDQGKSLDNPGLETTHMFITNCPSKELAMTFRSKTIDKWSAEEVQAVLDEYHLEVRLKGAASASAVCRMPSDDVRVNTAGLVDTGIPSSCQQPATAAKPSDASALDRVISMLEKVLLENSTRAQSMPNRQSKPKLPKIDGLTSLPCTVCGDATHTALTHCLNNKLCFQCHSPDHPRQKCPLLKPAESEN
ncbi:hypothetical protein ACEWY4_003885 [Coilia grayii]|uniref:Uncharacterized protein n=1 Tax=Coilia grayii TaxID=363190 RepID=A0ABD1KJY4_9TELE